MRELIKYFIKYPIASNVIMLLIIVFGTMGLSNLRKTFFPERTSKLITVQAVYQGASPLEIEQMVTLKIEDNLDGITGIKRVTSKSSENTSNVTIEINNDANNQFVLQDIKNAIDRISSFPNQMESPSIFLMENLRKLHGNVRMFFFTRHSASWNPPPGSAFGDTGSGRKYCTRG